MNHAPTPRYLFEDKFALGMFIYWPLATDCWLLTANRRRSRAALWLLTAYRSLLTAHCSLLTAH